MSPTARSMEWLKKQGFLPCVVERRMPHGNITHDLFGFIDVVALDGKPGLLGIQVTSASNAASRAMKVAAAPLLLDWLIAGNRVEVHGWGKRGARGERKRWKLCYRRAVMLGHEPHAITVSILEGEVDGASQEADKAGPRGVAGGQEGRQTPARGRKAQRCDSVTG